MDLVGVVVVCGSGENSKCKFFLGGIAKDTDEEKNECLENCVIDF